MNKTKSHLLYNFLGIIFLFFISFIQPIKYELNLAGTNNETESIKQQRLYLLNQNVLNLTVLHG
jgi:hypothetical protein